MTYINCNAKSIKKYSLNSDKVSVTVKPFITIKSFCKYQSITLTKIIFKIEANTQRLDIYQW